MARVYHPIADAARDVPDRDVKRWAKAGWTEEPGDHITDRPDTGAPTTETDG